MTEKNNPIPDPRQAQNRDENGAKVNNQNNAGNKTDASEDKGKARDENESYVDYNGNSETNNPARAGA